MPPNASPALAFTPVDHIHMSLRNLAFVLSFLRYPAQVRYIYIYDETTSNGRNAFACQTSKPLSHITLPFACFSLSAASVSRLSSCVPWRSCPHSLSTSIGSSSSMSYSFGGGGDVTICDFNFNLPELWSTCNHRTSLSHMPHAAHTFPYFTVSRLQFVIVFNSLIAFLFKPRRRLKAYDLGRTHQCTHRDCQKIETIFEEERKPHQARAET